MSSVFVSVVHVWTQSQKKVHIPIYKHCFLAWVELEESVGY